MKLGGGMAAPYAASHMLVMSTYACVALHWVCDGSQCNWNLVITFGKALELSFLQYPQRCYWSPACCEGR